MKKKIVVRGPALSRSGYGEQCRFALRSLRSQEELFDIYLLNTDWGKTSWIFEDDEERQWIDELIVKTSVYIQQTEDPDMDMSLQVTIPNEWERMAPVNIGYTAGIETNMVAPVWVEKSKIMDHIITISEHSKQVYEKTSYSVKDENTGAITDEDFKCTTPISVVHYPVRKLEEESVDLNLDYDFNFLTIAQWSVRKNLENTIRWFVEEFIDQEVGLVVKVSSMNDSCPDRFMTRERLEGLLAPYENRKCKVYMLHGMMTDVELNALYKHPKIKSCVTITHGEGFGLPTFEAACNGLPVVAPAWSGHVDYLYMPVKDKKTKKERLRPKFAKVDFDIGPIPPEAVWDGVLQGDSQWCYAQQGSYKMRLREVYKDHGRFKKQAGELQKWINKNFTEEKQYKKFVDCLSVEQKEIE